MRSGEPARDGTESRTIAATMRLASAPSASTAAPRPPPVAPAASRAPPRPAAGRPVGGDEEQPGWRSLLCNPARNPEQAAGGGGRPPRPVGGRAGGAQDRHEIALTAGPQPDDVHHRQRPPP